MEKCKACGYDNSYDIGKGKRVGDEEFIRIDGHFTTDSDNYYGPTKIVLLGCPKCYTVIFRKD